jgi:hypothetical protein
VDPRFPRPAQRFEKYKVNDAFPTGPASGAQDRADTVTFKIVTEGGARAGLEGWFHAVGTSTRR